MLYVIRWVETKFMVVKAEHLGDVPGGCVVDLGKLGSTFSSNGFHFQTKHAADQKAKELNINGMPKK